MKTIAIIPARFASKRLPGKMLLAESGKSLIQHTFERVKKGLCFDEIIVATDDARIFDTVRDFGGNAEMTDVNHKSGTDRIAEIVQKNADFEIIVNVQGDEPEIEPAYLQKLAQIMQENQGIELATLACPLSAEDAENPAAVKVVCTQDDFALYFSRAKIPFNRDESANAEYQLHVGVYAYRRETLLKLSKMPQTPLEQTEKLEQLRALENNIRIKVVKIPHSTKGIDTREDYDAFIRRCENSQ
ncbi:MAG: 3-deoxy-manno-octulosonate cytidylyltransferase [Planctomycetes bacterium]|nr:3-deoxy-manno-octulosonate cytidylyltransferase [Planctomycetota bacterium]